MVCRGKKCSWNKTHQCNQSLRWLSLGRELWKELVSQGFVWVASCCKTVVVSLMSIITITKQLLKTNTLCLTFLCGGLDTGCTRSRTRRLCACWSRWSVLKVNERNLRRAAAEITRPRGLNWTDDEWMINLMKTKENGTYSSQIKGVQWVMFVLLT